ncbi:TetR/AcrR family transcriptional regulator [Leadbettera azotonutricia]|uniref:Transcriptional regulator, TetR family n=1 Tax=Leadbettera azotonutricia (strain ATCC BAA-888 / DSM 13862 / ZAS-9) TaxID=545695 RepID=F5YC01_LEAAZ|nr:TetR/AcrR family transcriptional regulator [Leadbettera azotonutricia]AEF83069.1 transcriptional regulator, TetR family [Leadbettera azotonutricia ZAS-9]
MTNEDITRTAFKVWGRELYKTTSLTSIARELGVSKPALYRHFKDKQALLDAMYSSFFDEYAAFIKGSYEKALMTKDKGERFYIMMRAITEYYIRNKDAFLFSLLQVYSSLEMRAMAERLAANGINLVKLAREADDSGMYPSRSQFIFVTGIFWVAHFHRNIHKGEGAPEEKLVAGTLADMEKRIRHGLGLKVQKIAALDFNMLEAAAAGSYEKETEDNKLLQAVAGAVAQAGPWNASMEMVAKRSGLSKSGLYAHFKSRQDMLGRLFLTEFDRIIDYAGAKVNTSRVPEAQLYLAIFSIVDYLRSKPEILIALDWFKTRRLELGAEVPARIYDPITNIKLDVFAKAGDDSTHEAQWILFMIVNMLVRWIPGNKGDTAWPEEKKNERFKEIRNISNESARILYKFIVLGLEGLS